MVKDKRKMRKWVIVSLILVVILFIILSVLAWFVFVGTDYSDLYSGSGKVLENPVKGLSMEEAIEQFDEDNVYYLMVVIEGYNLHNPPLSDSTPKIELYVDGEIYSVEIVEGRISITEEEIEDKDIIIYSTKEEVVKMLISSDYIVESFDNGLSNVELVAGNFELASKGYLGLYDTFTS